IGGWQDLAPELHVHRADRNELAAVDENRAVDQPGVRKAVGLAADLVDGFDVVDAAPEAKREDDVLAGAARQRAGDMADARGIGKAAWKQRAVGALIKFEDVEMLPGSGRERPRLARQRARNLLGKVAARHPAVVVERHDDLARVRVAPGAMESKRA